MSGALVSVAILLVKSAAEKAASAAASEVSLLMGISTYIWFIRDELNTMYAFLEVAESIKNKDMLLMVWVGQVRDMSYDIEDCLDEFMVHVGSKSLVQRLMKLKDRHEIAIQIRDLKVRVEQVSSRNTRYSLIEKKQISSSADERDAVLEDNRNQSACNIDEAELVGFDKPKRELLELMDAHTRDHDLDGPAGVVCVVGMGGLGKTTITRNVYESINGFSCSAWVTVSQSLVRKDLLRSMIKGFFGYEALEKLNKEKLVAEEDLASYLRNELSEKRYFVVLDDLWNIDDWKWIKMMALPSGNNKGSQIIITTREVGLAKECTSESLIYHLEFLGADDAIDLLLRKTRKRREDMENNDNIMKNIVPKIVKKCGCLPLAILAIGGMLATKPITKWESVCNQLPSELESNTSLEPIKRIVTLSYNHLPYHLKSCFLYLSIFPEDIEIGRARLVQRWIAEGFVRAIGGDNAEYVGNLYFGELIDRSMIQSSKVNIEGTVKSCRVHDIMRDVIVSIARDGKFGYLVGDGSTSIAAERFRHVAYHGSKRQNMDIGWRHVRSLTMFGERPMEQSRSLCSPDMRMLRALDLEDADFMITPKDINKIGLLKHLKYVSLGDVRRFSDIYEIPRFVGNLQGLQFLDTRGVCIHALPGEVTQLRSLRSLRCTTKLFPKGCLPFFSYHAARYLEFDSLDKPRSGSSGGVGVPRGISNMKELQVLERVDIKKTSCKAITEIGELAQLRKLHVVRGGASERKCGAFCAAMEKLTSLSSLTVYDYDSSPPADWLHSVSSPPPLLRSLELIRMTMPAWVESLNNLVKLTLRGSRLKEGDLSIQALGELPSLMLLRLFNDAYVGEKLVLVAEAFPKLRKIELSLQSELKEVILEEGSSPLMEMIHISYCELEGINGVKHLPKLKKILIEHASKVVKLAELQGEVDAHPNHPMLKQDEVKSAPGESSSTAVTPSVNLLAATPTMN